jgi:hypothetical protein
MIRRQLLKSNRELSAMRLALMRDVPPLQCTLCEPSHMRFQAVDLCRFLRDKVVLFLVSCFP